ncbi:MAG: PQQ-binding-like beta-propeller repeat protein [Candidatus Bathyarchaeia archaeon]|jgi:outer membrane protein assembly factor BamB
MKNVKTKQVKNIREKSFAIFAIFLMIASVTLIAQPVQAQTTLPSNVTPTNVQENGSIALPSGVTPDVTVDTIAYLSFTPNPVGVGQNILVNIWFQPPIHVSRYLSGLEVTITDPSGNTEVIGPIDTYAGDATSWFEYPVDEEGTWTLEFDFPGGYFPAGNYTYVQSGTTRTVSFSQSVYYEPANTGEQELVVQEEQVYSWPESQLPTDYWTRPISPENREWWVIGGNSPFNSVGGGTEWEELYPDTNIYASNYKFTPWVTGPESAHIVWKDQGSVLAGITGGISGQWAAPFNYDEAYSTSTGAYGAGAGSAGNPNILFQGRLYGKVMSVLNGVAMYVWRCTDVRTGEVIWEQPWTSQMPTMITTAYDSLLVEGATQRADRLHMYLVYVGGGRLIKYSPTNGQVSSNVSISPLTTGTIYADPYVLSVQTISSGNYRLINWTMEGSSTDITTRIISNVSWPISSLPSVVDYEAGITVTTSSISNPATGVSTDARIIAYSLTTGNVIWNITAGVGAGIYTSNTAIADHGKFAVRFNDGYYYCFDLYSGKQLWKSESTDWPWDTFGAYYCSSAYGLLYDPTYSGFRAIDWDTGEVVWTFEAPTPYGYETPYEGQYSWFSGNIIADGKIYSYNFEHSPSAPLTRGWRLFCINATSGEGIWNITGPQVPGLIADGYLTTCNWYDGYMYVYGKGKSATTIESPSTAISLGASVVLKGTVLDQSSAQAGTACVSEESMTVWMEYLHMQKSVPANVTGVTVSLDTVDPNGNYIHIGDVTTDGYSGTFGYTWEPEIPGQYTVTATFMGDNSYGSSFATSYVSVIEAPEATQTATPINFNMDTINNNTTMSIAAVGIVIIIAIAIVGLLILKKK